MIKYSLRAALYAILLAALPAIVLLFGSLLYAQSPEPAAPAAPQVERYFQQSVHYTLDGTMLDDPAKPMLTGSGSLEYTNHSPDTLTEVYFHLYWNLFKNGSYGEQAPNRDHSDDDEYGSEGITVERFTESSGNTDLDRSRDIEIDNTILRLKLHTPLLPGASRRFRFDWRGQFPNFGIRSTWGFHDNRNRNFATAQWYPQVCVYDNHGWHPDQYIGMGEFYTDYGSFDVTLHLPASFTTVVSTGWQTNSEMLPAQLRTQLEFARQHPDSIVHISDHSADEIAKTKELTTWKFHADSVRDFAWCADDGYIWDAVYTNGTMHHALYWKNSKDFWGAEAARIARHSVQFFSKLAGQYLYPNLFMCETYEGGMEYPGIVYIGPYTSGSDYHYSQNTMMHEIGHQWYPMMMGSNETDYGYMDEGFNTFITTLAHEAWFGRWDNSYGPDMGLHDDERTSNYRGAVKDMLGAFSEPPQTKADMFRTYYEYAVPTYDKTGSVFFMLRYVMGETAFNDFLKEYYNRWKLHHPYPGDLQQTAEDIERREGDTNRVRARGDLRWFFDQWFDKTWKLDYKLADLDVNGTSATVTIDRLERAVMPLDLVFTLADGSQVQKWIPVDDWLRTGAKRRTYTYSFASAPVKVEINPSLELLDINRLNNTSDWIPKIDAKPLFSLTSSSVKPIDAYAIRIAPFAAYFKDDGGIFGATASGSYLDRDARMALGIRYGTKYSSSIPLGGVFEYHTVLDAISPLTDLEVEAVHADNRTLGGLKVGQVITQADNDPLHVITFSYDWSHAAGSFLTRHTEDWSPTNPATMQYTLNRMELGYALHSTFDGHQFNLASTVEAGLGDPRTNYTKITGEANLRLQVTDNWDAFLRVFGGSSQPSNGATLPLQTSYWLSGANPLQTFEDIYASNFGSGVRDKIRNPVASGTYLRGYSLQDASGRVAASSSVELSNNSLFPFNLLRSIPLVGRLFHFVGLSLFADGGLVTDRFCTCRLKEDLRTDFGVGLRVNRYLRYLDIDFDRTEARLDFPIYLSNPRAGEKMYAFRMTAAVRQNF